jgi:hypothetical protein
MIQRKQTLFLLAVLIINIILFFLPFLNISLSDNTEIYGLSFIGGCGPSISNSNTIYPSILNTCIVVLALITIFLYKRRTIQFKLSNIIVLLNVVITGLFFLLSYIKEGVIGEIQYTFVTFMPIISATFAFLAAHYIKKDEQLVRNSDRIR